MKYVIQNKENQEVFWDRSLKDWLHVSKIVKFDTLDEKVMEGVIDGVYVTLEQAQDISEAYMESINPYRYGSEEHQMYGDAWLYQDCPGAW